MESAASEMIPNLYAALTLAERVSSLRQVDASWVERRTDPGRAAEAIARWKSQEPFTTSNYLPLDGLTEERLLAILGLRPETYAELFSTSPEWMRDLERLYSSEDVSLSDGEQFVEWAREGTNAFLWIAYPIIQEGLRRFREQADRLAVGSAPFEPASVQRLVLPSLLATLKPAVEKVMVLELNVARIRGLLKGELPAERFRSFCDTLRERDVRWSIVREYPVLFRSLLINTMNWVDYSVELLNRLTKDWQLIQEDLALFKDVGEVTAIRAGAGDRHRAGRSVAILEFSSGWKLIYKPHSLSLDAHFAEFLEWVSQTGFEPRFRTLKVVDRGCYGWSEFAAHSPCSSLAEVERFYRRLGAYLAVFYLFKTADMYSENLIAAGEFPVPIDLETLFHPIVEEREDPAAGVCQSSVLRAMLLPTRVFASETQEGVDISGLGAKGVPHFSARSASREETETDEMRLVYPKAVSRVAGNRPKLKGEDVVLGDFLEPFLHGFEQMYRLLEARREELLAPGGMLDRFAEDEIRFVGRPTHTYSTLLTKAFHPDMLRNAIDRDQLFDSLWLWTADLPYMTQLVPAELRDLEQGDVPLFITRPNSRDVWTSRGEPIPGIFEQTVLERVRRGASQMGDDDLSLQTRLIRTAIASAGERGVRTSPPPKLQSPGSGAAAELARSFGDILCREVFESDAYANWIGLTPVGSREISWCLQPLDVGFYSGLSGCSFFLAYLGALTADRSYSKIARKSINLVRRQLERTRGSRPPMWSLGGYSGLGGIIYTLTHLGVLWRDASLINEATALAEQLPSLIERDRMLDVVGGSAGCIGALAVLNEVSPSERLLNIATLCGERLLRHQQPHRAGVAWKTQVPSSQPLNGFSHGAAGIAWALLKLSAWSKDLRFRTAAESAIAYERSTFVAEEANWPDFRTGYLDPEQPPAKPGFSDGWCNGAAGIGLARIDSLRHMDDHQTREEIEVALRKTAESGFGMNHCLCHGDLGKLDVLRYAAQQGYERWWTERGESLTRQTLSTIAEGRCSCGTQDFREAPGLLVGLAGIGYGLLRLSFPGRVASVLVLAGPVMEA